jgi:hypothetical protein
MDRQEIRQTLFWLAQSQGFYGRVLRNIEEAPNQDEIWEKLEQLDFKDPLDIVMYFEC